MKPVPSTVVLSALLLLSRRAEEQAEACSCAPAHPQQLICDAALDKVATAVLYKSNFPVFRTIVFHDIQSAQRLSNNLEKKPEDLKIRLHGDKKM